MYAASIYARWRPCFGGNADSMSAMRPFMSAMRSVVRQCGVDVGNAELMSAMRIEEAEEEGGRRKAAEEEGLSVCAGSARRDLTGAIRMT
eukprot:372283-Rhodomonas_salina.1